MKNVAAGANPMALKKGIEKATAVILTNIKKMSTPVTTKEQVSQVASISAADESIGNLIAEVMEKVGKDGVVTVEEGKGIEFETEYVEGMQLDRGYISPYFVTSPERMEAAIEDPYILITDKKISAVADILFGTYNPSGKLPATFYKSVEDLPPFEDYNMKGRTYRYFEGEVLYPFGYGLSYTTFTYTKPELSSSSIGVDEKVKVIVNISNSGNYDGETVVQLYVKDIEATVVKPIKSLRHFKKVYLAKGTSMQVSFELSPDDLSIMDDQGQAFVEKGSFDIFVGEDSSTKNKAQLEVK